MTTTDLIELLKELEHDRSGRPRNVSLLIEDDNGETTYLHEPTINVNSTGTGIAGAEICLGINET